MNSDEVSFDEIKASTKSAFSMGPFGSRIKAENFVSEGVPVIKGGNLNGDLDSSAFDFLTPQKAAELSTSIARSLDLVITHRGTLGQVGIIPLNSRYPEYIVSQSQLKLSFDRTKVNPYFIYYFLRSPLGQRRLLANTSQVGVPAIAQALTSIRNIKIPLPSLNVQDNIVATLRLIDDRIVLLREANSTLEAIAQALFKSWFVDFDPVRAKQQGREPEGMDASVLFPDSFEESELGLVPSGWKIGVLSDITEAARKQISSAELNSNFNYVGLEHMPRQSLSLTNWSDAKGLESAKAAFSEGDILFGKLRPYFHKVAIAPFDGVCSTDILVCRAKSASYYGVVAMHLFSVALVEYANRLSNGAKMPRITWKDLAAYTICVPPISIAEKYILAVQPLFNRMTANVHQAQALTTLRDTLLPRLISGQLRLPEAEGLLEKINS